MRATAAPPLRFAVAIAVATAADVAFDPAHTHVPLCPFKAITGWQCPFCGGLRAADALAHGQLGAAARLNVLLVLAVPLVVAYWVAWVRGQRPRLGRPATVAAVVVAVIFTLVRNL